MTTEPMSLHRKLAEVMAAINWQPKTGRNQQQGYDFVSVEVIKDAVRTELAARHVMFYVSTDTITRSEYQTKSGSTMFHVDIQGEVTFADGDSGEMFTTKTAGEAADTGDKALNKALTAMVKYALIGTFLIPTGEDPDQETPEAKPAGRRPQAERSNPKPAPFAPLEGQEVPDDGQPEPKPKSRAGMVQCEAKSPFGTDDNPVQCRREMGHTGRHRTDVESWDAA